MDLSEIIRNLTGLGTPNPLQQAPQGDPAGGVRTPAPAPGGPATAAPPMPLQGAPGPAPGTGTSPPDMTALYQKMLDQERQDKYIDKGAAMIAAGFAQPANRAAILNAAGGGGGGGTSANTALTTILSLQKDQLAKQQLAQRRAMVPALAKKWGIDTDTALSLFDSGKLDEVLSSMVKPDTQIVQRADGSNILVDKRKGTQIGEDISPAKEADESTNDTKNYAAYVKDQTKLGKPSLSFNDWRNQASAAAANRTEINMGAKGAQKAMENRITQIDDEAKSIVGIDDKVNTVNTAEKMLQNGVVSGNAASPYINEGRKVLSQAFGIDDKEATNTDVFNSSVKRMAGDLLKSGIFGSGQSITDADRKVAEAIVGGQTITQDAAQTIFNATRRAYRDQVQRYNQNIDDFAGVDEDSAKASKYMKKQRMPALHLSEDHQNNLRTQYNNLPPDKKAAARAQVNKEYGGDAATQLFGDK